MLLTTRSVLDNRAQSRRSARGPLSSQLSAQTRRTGRSARDCAGVRKPPLVSRAAWGACLARAGPHPRSTRIRRLTRQVRGRVAALRSFLVLAVSCSLSPRWWRPGGPSRATRALAGD
jgi:hypothetical protein